MANEGNVVAGIALFCLALVGVAAGASASKERNVKKKALLERIDKEVQEAKEYLKGE